MRMIRLALLCAASTFFAANASAQATGAEVPVVRVWTTDDALISRIGGQHSHMIVDRKKGMIMFESDADEMAKLLGQGVNLEVDRAATEQLNRVVQRAPGQLSGIPGYSCYRTVDESNARLAQLANLYPNLVSIVDIGNSWKKTQGTGGDDLLVLKLTNSAIPGPKPKMFAMTAIHAREYTTAELNLRFAETLLAGYGTDADATMLLDHNEFHLLVQSNPDGRRRAEGQVLQRKNMNSTHCPGTGSTTGVDLNRNFPFQWHTLGENGSSSVECNDTYRGPTAASEPETTAVDAYIATIFPDVRGPADTDPAPTNTQGVFLDIHSYSQLVLWPWGATTGLAPNGPALETLGRRMGYFDPGYTPQQSVGLYPTDGATDDNAYGKLGVPAFTIELGTAFFEACSSFEQTTYPDNLKALQYVAKVLRAPYLLPSGPESRTLAVLPDLAVVGDPISVSAVVDDTRFNQNDGGTQPSQPIASASLYADVPPWSAGATAQAMSASDGSFNSATETVGATIAGGALSAGKHMLFVQGRDSSGSDGPVSAVFANIYAAQSVGDLAGTVRQYGTSAPIAASIDAGTWHANSNAGSGAFARHLPIGSYTVTVSAPGFESASFPAVAINGGQTTTQDATLYALCHRLDENAESGSNGWTTQVTAGSNTWGIANASGLMTSKFWTESPTGSYGNNANTSLISPVFDMTGYDNPVLSFDSVCNTESGWDFGLVEARPNASAAWTEVFRCSGDPTLKHVSVAVPALAGATAAQIRLRFTSDGGVTADGWAVDNIAVAAGGAACRASQGTADAMFSNGFE